MRPALDDFAVLQDDDLVAVANRAQAMRDNEARAAATTQVIVDNLLGRIAGIRKLANGPNRDTGARDNRRIVVDEPRPGNFANLIWAALTELHVTGQREVFAQRVLELTSLVVILGLACLVPIAAFNHAFIRLWVGEQTYAGDLVTILAAVNGLLASLLSVWIWLFDGTGQAARLVPMAVIGAALNIAASIVCTKRFQMPGPLIGTLLAYGGVQLIWLPILVRRTFGIRSACRHRRSP